MNPPSSTEPSTEEENPATLQRFPQHPAPQPLRARPRLPSPIEDELAATRAQEENE